MREWYNIEFTFVITKKALDGFNEYQIVAFDNSDNSYSKSEAKHVLTESCEDTGWKVLTAAENIADASDIINAMIDIDEVIEDEFGGSEGLDFEPPTFTN